MKSIISHLSIHKLKNFCSSYLTLLPFKAIPRNGERFVQNSIARITKLCPIKAMKANFRL